jgi:hypothetical protein
MLRLFKNTEDLCLVKVQVRGEVRPKSHSRHEVYLADWMRVTTEDWENRIKATDITP